MSKIIAVVSGGIDSVVMAHHLAERGHTLHVLSIDYGQRHDKELAFARAAADRLGFPYEQADLSAVKSVFRGSSLTDRTVEVPKFGTPTTRNPNIVPNRNALLLSVAFALAVVEEADAVAFGVMADDVGPSDTSPEFLTRFLAMEKVATARPELDLLAPLIELHKTGVVSLGEELGVPWEQTWTCFRGEELHCGVCAACAERRGAFDELGVKDPTEYAE
ncbi:7-cyano-7-deazaguanine synthase [Umezawaea sp.]|uniref:7-cyano-7-deazaguanine synthase n=1 Tax=Umezawaea sp. TaxID=1955258 RepID=UPI002ED0E50C